MAAKHSSSLSTARSAAPVSSRWIIALRAEPTPGRMTKGAAAMRSGSALTTLSRPRWRSAAQTERVLPAP